MYEDLQTPALGGWAVWLGCVAAVMLHRIVSGVLSTGVIHSVENLHACDLVE